MTLAPRYPRRGTKASTPPVGGGKAPFLRVHIPTSPQADTAQSMVFDSSLNRAEQRVRKFTATAAVQVAREGMPQVPASAAPGSPPGRRPSSPSRSTQHSPLPAGKAGAGYREALAHTRPEHRPDTPVPLVKGPETPKLALAEAAGEGKLGSLEQDRESLEELLAFFATLPEISNLRY